MTWENIPEKYLIRKEELEKAKEEARVIARKYGKGINPFDLILLKDKPPIELLKGTDENLLKGAKQKSFIAVPVKYKVSKSGKTIIFQYPNKVTAVLEVPDFDDDEKWFEYLNMVRGAYHVVEYVGNDWRVVEVRPRSINTEAGKQVIEAVGACKALALSVGLSDEGMKKYWHRLLPVLFEQAHVMELGEPGSGKTTFGLLIEKYYGFYYTTEPPSPAALVYDGRTRTYGIVYRSEGLILDEFDKVIAKSRSRAEVNEIIEILMSGMENGKWVRGVSTGTGTGAQIDEKIIPVMIMMNATEQLVKRSETPREYFERMLSTYKITGAKAFIERITLPVIKEGKGYKFNPSDASEVILRPAVARGVIALLREYAKQIPVPEKFSNARMQRHYSYVYRFL